MEDKMAWRRAQAELVENHRLAQEMSATLAKAQACRAELLSCRTADWDGSSYSCVQDKRKGDTVVKGELVVLLGYTFYIL